MIYRAKYDINLTYNLAHQTDKILEEGGKSRIYNHLWRVKAVLPDYPGPAVLGANWLACSMVCIVWRIDYLGFILKSRNELRLISSWNICWAWRTILLLSSCFKTVASLSFFSSVPTPPPCTLNSFSTTDIVIKTLFIMVQPNFSHREPASWLVWGSIAKCIRFISGEQMQIAWCCDTASTWGKSVQWYTAGCAKTKI